MNTLHCNHILDYYRLKRDTAMRAFEHASANHHIQTCTVHANEFDFYHSATACLLRADHFASLMVEMQARWHDVVIGWRTA